MERNTFIFLPTPVTQATLIFLPSSVPQAVSRQSGCNCAPYAQNEKSRWSQTGLGHCCAIICLVFVFSSCEAASKTWHFPVIGASSLFMADPSVHTWAHAKMMTHGGLLDGLRMGSSHPRKANHVVRGLGVWAGWFSLTFQPLGRGKGDRGWIHVTDDPINNAYIMKAQ